MPDLVAKELNKLIDRARELAEETDYERESDGFWNDYGSLWSALGYDDLILPYELTSEISITRVVENYGGGEGSGETRWIVFAVQTPGGELLFKKTGAYYSFEGDNWDYGSLFLVEPKEKTITTYEKVK